MPYKDPEARNAAARARYARLIAEDPARIAEQKQKAAEAFKKKYAEDEAFRERRKARYQKWYDEHGKENARERKGYMPLEEYLAECDKKAKYQREYMKQWGQTEAGRRSRVARSVRNRCGLSIEDYDRFYDEQQGKCKICGVEKERYAKDRLVVDHCHTSGQFRALLCANCNSAIGLLGESEETLTKAIEYLRSLRSST